jgi:hypothetical protein
MQRRFALIVLTLIGLVASILACNAPTPTPEDLSPTGTTDVSPTSSPQDTTTPMPTETPPQPSPTPKTQPSTETPTPTPSPTLTPTPTAPVSTGPLDFPVPAALDHWRALENGEQEATIILHITGGAPPYTIYHDQTVVTTTWETAPAIVFQARGCSALVHTIIVESADGQSKKHDYWIPVPWCD